MRRVKNPAARTLLILALSLAPVGPVFGQSLAELEERRGDLDSLLADLAKPDLRTWEATEDKIVGLWSRSGSETADLLLQRGRDALEEEDYATAIEHLTALTDHAPDFAEGWHTRATAFYMMDEYGLALADLERTLVLNPRHFAALTGMGIVLEELGNHELALAAMRLAHALNPHRDNINDAIKRLEYRLGEATL